MLMNTIYLLFSIIFFISFTVSIVLHKKRLKRILEIEDRSELSSAKYLVQPYITLANLSFGLALTFLILAILLPQIPFEIAIGQNSVFVYRTEDSLIMDMFYTIIAVELVLSIYPIIEGRSLLSFWLEFWIGFLAGTGFLMLFASPKFIFRPFFIALIIMIKSDLGTHQLLGMAGGSMLIMLYYIIMGLIFIIILIGYAVRQSFVMSGALFGVTFFLGLVFNISNLDILAFWLFYAFCIGVLVGILYVLGSNFLIWAFPLFVVILVIFQKVVLCFTFLLGLALLLIFVLEPKPKIKLALAFVFSASFFIINGLFYNLAFELSFIVCLVLGLFFIAELSKNATRSIFYKWIFLSIRSKPEGKVDLSEHKSIPNFKKGLIDTNSFLMGYLKYLLLKPLEKNNFSLEVIEKEDKLGVKYVKGILINLEESKLKEWENKVISALERLENRSKKNKLSIKEIARESKLTDLQVNAVFVISNEPKIKTKFKQYAP